VWELAADRRWIDSAVFSKPSAVFGFLFSNALTSRELWVDTYYTVAATLIAFALGSIAGILCGLLFVRVPYLELVTRPFVTLLNSFPRIALAPLFVVWFGIGLASKIVVAISLIFFMLLLNTVAGAQSVDRDHIRLSQTLGASPREIFRYVTLPTAAPSIFAGLKLGLVYSFLGVIVGEMVSAVHGLGQRAVYYSNVFEMDRALAVLIFLAVITTVLATVMDVSQSRVLRWQK